jgi:hypothetical protein
LSTFVPIRPFHYQFTIKDSPCSRVILDFCLCATSLARHALPNPAATLTDRN